MFTTKKISLVTPRKKAVVASKASKIVSMSPAPSKNSFVLAAQKKSVETVSGNGAKKLSSTLNAFVDQFGTIGTYKKPRSFAEIERDCETLWGLDKLNAVKFIHYLRTISRKVQLIDGTTTEGFDAFNDGYGNKVEILNNDGRRVVYGHLRESYVKPGDKVTRDMVIGITGCSGGSRVPHLHVEIRKSNTEETGLDYTIDPLTVLPKKDLRRAIYPLRNSITTSRICWTATIF